VNAQRGFTLLEAIVALVLLTAALAGAWTWIASDVRSLTRVRDLALEEAAVQQAVATLEQVDLAREPEGNLRWREFRIDWHAVPVEDPQQGRTVSGGKGAFTLTLYSVTLDVRHRERLIATPALRILGYERNATSGALQ
jgi:general secretion pathway protein I